VDGDVRLRDVDHSAHAVGREMIEGISDYSGAAAVRCGVKGLLEVIEVIEQARVALLEFYEKMSPQGIQITVLLENSRRHKRECPAMLGICMEL
jgi:hypothetical protein